MSVRTSEATRGKGSSVNYKNKNELTRKSFVGDNRKKLTTYC